MKPYKFDFKKGCGYRSKDYLISYFDDGSIQLTSDDEVYSTNMLFILQPFYLSTIQHNAITHVGIKSIKHPFFDKIFERISDA